ncbi:TIGR02221 family CRISPR-associated protein [Cyanobacterium aponinum UTEX 3221]|uniref:TIGR02221 family CRISPR-associated protein n=1 Tax=Cyanobacterium aponinum TaxID=379064 RepID=UPI002B4C1C0F|nr:TIGR02221 family CRISPR-associated protein [Cyanobacterium aponinum]WRL39046.1 TIGR02221 family CRISPR-associated protein [Cyanobacterium aponinum UTEX 3221]
MILLSFIGTGDYKLTSYTWQNQQYETEYVIEAIAHFFNAQEIKVFTTKEAIKIHGNHLRDKIDNKFDLSYIDIPSGTDEDDIWKLFDKVVESVPENSEIIFDITHAFRSIPVIVLLASAFLEKARNVKIKGVYYGQYDPKNNRASIFDLTPAIKLLDWLTATDTFINTGSSQKLGQLLADIQNDFFKSGRAKTEEIKPNKLRNLGSTISTISENIEFIRPVELLTSAHHLTKYSGEEIREEVGIFAKPFELIIDKIEQDYAQFALENQDKADPKLIIKKHYLLIKWYVEKGLGTQAILLAREWLVTTLAILENDNYLDKEARKNIENQLNAMSGNNPERIKFYEQEITKHIEDVKQLDDTWSQLGRNRNNIAHCQMNSEQFSSKVLQRYTQELPQILADLFPQLNLTSVWFKNTR